MLSIPREALYSENGKPYVYKVVGGPIETHAGGAGDNQSDTGGDCLGLNEGDTVATGTTTGQPLQVGIPIKVVQ